MITLHHLYYLKKIISGPPSDSPTDKLGPIQDHFPEPPLGDEATSPAQRMFCQVYKTCKGPFQSSGASPETDYLIYAQARLQLLVIYVNALEHGSEISGKEVANIKTLTQSLPPFLAPLLSLKDSSSQTLFDLIEEQDTDLYGYSANVKKWVREALEVPMAQLELMKQASAEGVKFNLIVQTVKKADHWIDRSSSLTPDLPDLLPEQSDAWVKAGRLTVGHKACNSAAPELVFGNSKTTGFKAKRDHGSGSTSTAKPADTGRKHIHLKSKASNTEQVFLLDVSDLSPSMDSYGVIQFGDTKEVEDSIRELKEESRVWDIFSKKQPPKTISHEQPGFNVYFSASGELKLLRKQERQGARLDTSPTSQSLSPHEVCIAAYDMATSLSYVHDQGLLYLDLKPDNMLQAPESEGEGYRLIDFNMCGPPADVTWYRGSPSYLPGEIIRSPGGDATTLALTLMQLANKDCFKKDWVDNYANNEQFLVGIEQTTKERMSALRAFFKVWATKTTLPKSLKKLIGKCFEKDPKKRPSMSAFLKARDVQKAHQSRKTGEQLIAQRESQLTQKWESLDKEGLFVSELEPVIIDIAHYLNVKPNDLKWSQRMHEAYGLLLKSHQNSGRNVQPNSTLAKEIERKQAILAERITVLKGGSVTLADERATEVAEKERTTSQFSAPVTALPVESLPATSPTLLADFKNALLNTFLGFEDQQRDLMDRFLVTIQKRHGIDKDMLLKYTTFDESLEHCAKKLKDDVAVLDHLKETCQLESESFFGSDRGSISSRSTQSDLGSLMDKELSWVYNPQDERDVSIIVSLDKDTLTWTMAYQSDLGLTEEFSSQDSGFQDTSTLIFKAPRLEITDKGELVTHSAKCDKVVNDAFALMAMFGEKTPIHFRDRADTLQWDHDGDIHINLSTSLVIPQADMLFFQFLHTKVDQSKQCQLMDVYQTIGENDISPEQDMARFTLFLYSLDYLVSLKEENSEDAFTQAEIDLLQSLMTPPVSCIQDRIPSLSINTTVAELQDWRDSIGQPMHKVSQALSSCHAYPDYQPLITFYLTGEHDKSRLPEQNKLIKKINTSAKPTDPPSKKREHYLNQSISYLRLLFGILDQMYDSDSESTDSKSLNATDRQLINHLCDLSPDFTRPIVDQIRQFETNNELKMWINNNGIPALGSISVLKKLPDVEVATRKAKSEDFWTTQPTTQLAPDLPPLHPRQFQDWSEQGRFTHICPSGGAPYPLAHSKQTGYRTGKPIGSGGNNRVKHGDLESSQVVLKATKQGNLFTSSGLYTVSQDGLYKAKVDKKKLQKLKASLAQEDTLPKEMEKPEATPPEALSRQQSGVIVYFNHRGELTTLRKAPLEGKAIPIKPTDTQPALSNHQIGCLISDMMDAFEWLLEQHLLHFDVKPDNILFGQDEDHFKLIDFGSVNPIGMDSVPTLVYVAGEEYNTAQGDISSFAISLMKIIHPQIFTKWEIPKKGGSNDLDGRLEKLDRFFKEDFVPAFGRAYEAGSPTQRDALLALNPLLSLIQKCFSSDAQRPSIEDFRTLKLVKTAQFKRSKDMGSKKQNQKTALQEKKETLIEQLKTDPSTDRDTKLRELLSILKDLITLDPDNATFVREMIQVYRLLNDVKFITFSEDLGKEVNHKIRILEERLEIMQLEADAKAKAEAEARANRDRSTAFLY